MPEDPVPDDSPSPDPDPPSFERIPPSSVYETRVAGSVGWSGYLLPPGGSTPETIGFLASLESFDGHYLFSVERPTVLDDDPLGFAKELLSYIHNVSNNRVALWLRVANPVELGPFESFGFGFGPTITGDFELRSDLNVRIGANAIFFALQQTALRVDEAISGLRLSAPVGSGPLLGFDNGAGEPLGVAVTGSSSFLRARVPFTGTNSGCFAFTADMDTRQILRAGGGVRLGFTMVADNRESGQRESPRYAAYASLPRDLAVVGTVDPSDPVNAVVGNAALESGHLRSGFTVAGRPQLLSNYRTPEGRAVTLVPAGTVDGDVVPPLLAGGFAWASPSPAATLPGESFVELAPVGQHGIVVDGAGAGSERALLGGLFGSERLSFRNWDAASPIDANDRLFFLASQAAFAPVFPFSAAALERPDSGAVRPRLTTEHRTPWATILAGDATAIFYRAEPEGSALYGLGPGGAAAAIPAVLVSTPPRMKIAQGTAHTFPLLPYGAASQAGVSGDTLTQFESQIVAATRKTRISEDATETWEARRLALVRRLEVKAVPGTTPQGFIVQQEQASSAYLNVRLAQSLNRRQQPRVCDPSGAAPALLPFAFDAPTRAVQDALQTNQLFLVAVNPGPFDDPTTGACFDNVINLAGWTMTAAVGQDSTATSYRNVMIFKFCSGSLAERVTNPNRWTAPETFSLLEGTPAATASLAFTGLSQDLQATIAAGIERADGRSAAFYRNFKRIVTDPEWTGVLVLEAELAAGDLPPEIAGLAAGIDLTRFAAHHFGFTVSQVEVDPATGAITMGEDESSLFGLVDYEDPAYASNLEQGVDPNTPIPVSTDGDFDFTVLQLQSLFENARLVDFQSRIQLTVERLFGAPVSRVYTRGVAQPANGLVLDGSYVDQGGKEAYVFVQDTPSVLHSPSNVLPAVAFDRVQFNTLGSRGGGAGGVTVDSRFVIWGALDFEQLDDAAGQLLDVLSFGSPPGTEEEALGAGLAFSNLLLEMSFPQATPNAKVLALDTANLAFDPNASSARPESLFAGFGLELKSFTDAAGEQTPGDLGFLPVSSGLRLSKLEGAWFGVVYGITLGGPGALASEAGFTSTLLVAWSPSTTRGDANRAVFLGMTLPGSAPGAKLFSLQGIFKVAVGAISILRQKVPKAPGRADAADASFYCLRIDDIGIKVFSIVKLPPSANIQFFLFGDPASTGSLGWYAAFVADDDPGCNQQLAFAELGPAALPPPAGDPPFGLEAGFEEAER
jgi:hypothetical protein